MDWRKKIRDNIHGNLNNEGVYCNDRYCYSENYRKARSCNNFPKKCNKCIEITNKLKHNNAGIYKYLNKCKIPWRWIAKKKNNAWDSILEHKFETIVITLAFTWIIFCVIMIIKEYMR